MFAVIAAFASGTAAQEKLKFPGSVGTKTIGANRFWRATKNGSWVETTSES